MTIASTHVMPRHNHPSHSSQQDMFDIHQAKNLRDEELYLPSIDEEPDVLWDEKGVVELHWLLLKKLETLPDPQTPLEEKFELLRWIFTDHIHDQMPFSFVSCLEVVATSPLSPTAYFGKISSDEIREWIARNVKGWLQASFAQYPSWIQFEIIHNPDWVAQQLDKNPQWINQQIKRSTVQPDLFP